MGDNLIPVLLASGYKHLKNEGVYGDLWTKSKDNPAQKAEV